MKATLYQKIRQMREDVISLDWKPDKKYTVKGNFVYYVSISKMRRNFAPLFADAGLDFNFNIVDILDYDDFTRIKIEFIITDCDNGDRDVCTLYADGPRYYTKSNGEKEHEGKGIEIALSYGARMYFTNKFQVVDGIEADTEDYNAETLIQDELNVRAIPEEPTIVIPKATPQVTIPLSTAPNATPTTVSIPNVGHKTIVGTPKVNLWNKDADATEKTVTEVVKVDSQTEPPAVVKVQEQKVIETVEEATTTVKVPSVVSDKEKIAADKAMSVIEQAYKKGELVEESFEHAKNLYNDLNSANVAILLSLKKDIESSLGKDAGL